jgi:hypothetical protein
MTTRCNGAAVGVGVVVVERVCAMAVVVEVFGDPLAEQLAATRSAAKKVAGWIARP